MQVAGLKSSILSYAGQKQKDRAHVSVLSKISLLDFLGHTAE